jgi:hypothetical protein
MGEYKRLKGKGERGKGKGVNRSPTRGEVFTFPIKFGLFRPQGARLLPFPFPLFVKNYCHSNYGLLKE